MVRLVSDMKLCGGRRRRRLRLRGEVRVQWVWLIHPCVRAGGRGNRSRCCML